MLTRHVISAIAALLLATSATAQPTGTWEVGAVGRYTDFAPVVALDNGIGVGAWIGYFPIPRLELELASSLTSTQRPAASPIDAVYVPTRARLIYNQPALNFIDVRIGAGYIFNSYRIDPEWYGDHGVTALVGSRLYLSRSVAILLAGTADYLPAYSDRTDAFGDLISWGVEAGLSFLLGGRPRGGGVPVVVASETPEVQEAPAPAVEEPPATEEVVPPPEPDSDGDGVSDGVDRCPDTAAGAEVDAEGCPPTRDGDGDGVIDSVDRCEGTPPGSEVDSVGCPVLLDLSAIEVTLEDTFRPGTWELTPAGQQILDGVAQALLAHPTVRIAIAGYTDNVGEERRNVWLSQTRADAVKLYLSRQGVPRDRMVTRGYGPADPVASNETPEGRARNRRIELRSLK